MPGAPLLRSSRVKTDDLLLITIAYKLGRDLAGEVESEWMVPLLIESERDRLMAWQLGVSL